MIGFAKSHFKKGFIWSYVESRPLHNHVYKRYKLKKARNKPINMHKIIFSLSTFCYSKLRNIASGLVLVEPKTTMVEERIRREPWGEVKRRKEKRKVWRKL